MLTELSYNNFNKFRNKLLDYSRRFNIRFEDLEELVNDSILKALDNFDSERGSFESLCIVILKHKIFNFKRDNPFLYFLVLLDENENIFKADEKSIEEKESIEKASNFLNELKTKLSVDEIKLVNEIYNMCETSTKLSISKASKNIGIEPLKGWDIFRKIQRKANDFIAYEPPICCIDETEKIKTHMFYEIEVAQNRVTIISERQVDFENSKAQFSFSEDVISKLNSLYNF